MRALAAFASVVFLSSCCLSCLEPKGHTLFGSDLPSADGGTFLTVDDVSLPCVLELDGKPWGTVGARIPIKPGTYTVGCRDGERVEVTVAAGHDVLVNYFGP